VAVGTLARRRKAALALGTPSLLVALAGCAPTVTTPVGLSLPSGARLFAAPPARADCARLDLDGLRTVAGGDVPTPTPILTYADAAKPHLTWTGCAGVLPAANSSADSTATDQPTDGASTAANNNGSAAKSSGSGAATAEGSVGQVSWVVRYATTSAAARTAPRTNPLADATDVHSLSRPARLADAEGTVVLDVHADDHATLVWVTVRNPATGRQSAECGLVDVPGASADAAATWCLGAVAGLLVHGAGHTATGA
jgi:hypothetical protein